MKQDHPESELRREAREYIEALKPEWHAALAGFERETAEAGQAPRGEAQRRAATAPR